jgi:hypothetical protein
MYRRLAGIDCHLRLLQVLGTLDRFPGRLHQASSREPPRPGHFGVASCPQRGASVRLPASAVSSRLLSPNVNRNGVRDVFSLAHAYRRRAGAPVRGCVDCVGGVASPSHPAGHRSDRGQRGTLPIGVAATRPIGSSALAPRATALSSAGSRTQRGMCVRFEERASARCLGGSCT